MAILNNLLVQGAARIIGTLYAGTFSGNGASLTSLNASNITSGTLAAARLATSGVTAGSAGPTAAVTGSNNTTVAIPRITVDTYGRVTALTSYNLTCKNDNTTYSAGDGISLSGTKFSLASGVVTAGSAGPTAAVTGSHGTTVAIPRITVDTYGRVTALTSYNLTCQNTNTNTWTAFAGATATADGTAGYVPAPGKGNQAKFFRGDGTWQAVSIPVTLSSTSKSATAIAESTWSA